MNLVLMFGAGVSPEDAQARFDEAIRFAQRYPCRLVILASLAFTLSTPVSAATKASNIVAFEEALQGDFDKRKKKRVKGGSGCDDAGDILEHPECR
jgi:hypothetical protein